MERGGTAKNGSKRPATGRVREKSRARRPAAPPGGALSERAYRLKLRQMAFEAVLQEERQRRRIAADLHDRIGQPLAVAHMKLASVRGTARPEVLAAIDDAQRMLQRTLADARSLTFEISPPILYDLGLVAGLRWFAEDLGKRHGTQVDIKEPRAFPKLDDDLAAILFRCVRELLVNVTRHAGTQHAVVTLRVAAEKVHILVRDRGTGFDGRPGRRGLGLFAVREQVNQLGGSLELKSTPRRGTTAKIVVPIEVAVSSDSGERTRRGQR